MTANESHLGGGAVVSHPPPLLLPAGLSLLSDLHIGARSTDYDLIASDLEEAYENDDRILLNGDIFDGIFPSDKKRYRPSTLHSRISGVDDIANKLVDWAVEILSPVAHLIDMIGVGNHDDSLAKSNSFDPVLALVDRLNCSLDNIGEDHRIAYGGYCGFVCYKLQGTKKRFNIFYHHGFGKSGKGALDYERLHWVEGVDLVWLGHLHSRSTSHHTRISPPRSGSTVSSRSVRFVRTGAYATTYQGQTQESLREHGSGINYGVAAAHHPHGSGGARVLLSSSGEVKVLQ